MQVAEVKWSFSGMKDYINCPKKYFEVKVKKNFATKDTNQTLYGKDVHSALEGYIGNGDPLPKNYQRFKAQVDPLRDMEGTKYPEYKMALTYDKQACGFDDPNYWVRGIADLLVLAGDTAFIIDYKTGSDRYVDTNQLKLMALMAFSHFPNLRRVKAALLFVMHEHFIPVEYTREEIPAMWEAFLPTISRIAHSHHNDKWPANPTGLCGWCPVISCEFNNPKEQNRALRK